MGTQKTDINRDLWEPEKQYRDLYDNAPIAYFTVNAADGHILNCNKEAQRLLGYSRAVMLQMKVFELYAETLHGLPKAQKVFKEFKAGRPIRSIELQVKQQSGHLIWVSLSVEPEMDPDGKTLRSRSMMVDISDRKEAEIALKKIYNNVQNLVDERTAELVAVNAKLKQEIEERKKAENVLRENAKTLHTLLNATTNLVMLLNADGTLVTANDQACERYGKTLQEFKGLNLFSLMPAELAKSRKKLADAAIQSKHPVCCSEEFEGMFYNCIIYPILDDKGLVRKYSVFVQDVTPLKLAEAELIREQVNLEHRVKERTKELVETNNALSVLARNIDQKRERVQDKTTRTVNSKVLPIIEQFQKNKAFSKQKPQFDALKAYLKELTADSKDELCVIFILSNTELRVATMIKNGFTSPEIARLLNISLDTVKTHRKNIRRKLNICNSKINLTTYLRAQIE